MKIWQVAAGDGSRDYTELFLKYGVILVGPGSAGDYFQNKEVYNSAESKDYRAFIRVIAEDMNQDDLVILKQPHGRSWKIVAVGKVTSDYLHKEVFGDVEGWRLQHCRRIQWRRPLNPTVNNGLRRGTLLGVNSQQAINEATAIWSTGNAMVSEDLPPEPEKEEEISVDQLIDSLMIEGLPGNGAEVIAATIWRLRRIARWYSEHAADVGEHEIRTFLIVPLLTSLGWAEQKIKIEWNSIDVAIFDSPYSKESKPVVIIESKRLGDGLLYAPEQATRYAHNYPTCSLFVVSDGIRYKLYQKETDGSWRYASYMNLLFPKHNHPYDKGVQGAVSFFLALIPRAAI
jgi:hypothetical protein